MLRGWATTTMRTARGRGSSWRLLPPAGRLVAQQVPPPEGTRAAAAAAVRNYHDHIHDHYHPLRLRMGVFVGAVEECSWRVAVFVQEACLGASLGKSRFVESSDPIVAWAYCGGAGGLALCHPFETLLSPYNPEDDNDDSSILDGDAVWNMAVPKKKVTRHKKRLKTTVQKRLKPRTDIVHDPRTGEITLRHKLPFNWRDYLPGATAAGSADGGGGSAP